MPASTKYKHRQLKTFITLWKYFRMLRDPLAVQKTLADHMWSKNICKTRKIWNHLTWQPLLARHVCVRVCECVCVCVCRSTTLWWSAVEVSAKKHTYLSLSSNTYISLKYNKLNLNMYFV